MGDDQGNRDRRASSPEIIRLPEGTIRPSEIARLPESDVVQAPPAPPTMPAAPPAPEIVRLPEAETLPTIEPTEAPGTWLPPVVITELKPRPRRRLGATRVVLIALAAIILAGAAVAVVRLLTQNGSGTTPNTAPSVPPAPAVVFVHGSGTAGG